MVEPVVNINICGGKRQQTIELACGGGDGARLWSHLLIIDATFTCVYLRIEEGGGSSSKPLYEMLWLTTRARCRTGYRTGMIGVRSYNVAVLFVLDHIYIMLIKI